MKKKAYIIPQTMIVVVETAQLIAFSGGGDSTNGDPIVDPEADDSDEEGRSRRTYNCWEDDEDEEDW
ncbi:MAG: hypothetical protein J5545_00900 [Bacteroidaceae bacterium]|nr:hypothetical protein [Bacteroidaceae bacterium]